MKALTVYYSRKGENYFPAEGIKNVEKGNTAYAAEYIKKATKSDIFEIDTVKPYSADYKECCIANDDSIHSSTRRFAD